MAVDIKVNLTALTHGRPDTHCVNIRAEVATGDSPLRVYETSVPRYKDHKERPMAECTEEAIANILRQMLS